jgi:hypothetical protein
MVFSASMPLPENFGKNKNLHPSQNDLDKSAENKVP